jgi:protein-disulfide isomerase
MNTIVKISDTDHVAGYPNSPVILLEYGDYECPYCGKAYYVIKKLQESFGIHLGFVFRNFPLTEIHPHALIAAYIAEAAGLQNKFWQMHDSIFENQNKMELDQILNLAESIDADIDKLMKDCHSHGIKNKVENDLESGILSGVNGTPAFFINGMRYDGDHSFEAIKKALLLDLHI